MSLLRAPPSARRQPSIDFNGSSYVYTGTTCKFAETCTSGPNFNAEHSRRRPVRLDGGRGGGSERDGERVGVHRPRRLRQRWLMHQSRDRARRRRRLRRQHRLPPRGLLFPGRNGLLCVDDTSVRPARSARRSPSPPRAHTRARAPTTARSSGSPLRFATRPRWESLSGLGGVDFYVYLGVPDTTTVGQMDAVDEPFAVSVDC